MTSLLIHIPVLSDSSSGTLFGGSPALPRGTPFKWPVCKSCDGNMQFLGRISVPADESRESRFVQIFMCQNDPGCCNEWDPAAGGNFVLVTPSAAIEAVEVPQTGLTLRETTYGAMIVSLSTPDYESARREWSAANARPTREVLGQIFGAPAWIQGDETPTCADCGRSMEFLAQLEEGPDWRTEMNFGGGGCAYVFECSCGSSIGKLLWQCS